MEDGSTKTELSPVRVRIVIIVPLHTFFFVAVPSFSSTYPLVFWYLFVSHETLMIYHKRDP